MMQRDIHLTPGQFFESLPINNKDFGDIALVSGQPHRVHKCLEYLENPVKNFIFSGHTFWTGEYKGRKVTVGNGGLYSPDTAIITEILCEAGVCVLLRLGSCGALCASMRIGDFVVVERVIRGDGVTFSYVDKEFVPCADKEVKEKLNACLSKGGAVYQGDVWTTDALFKETKEIVNSYIDKTTRLQRQGNIHNALLMLDKELGARVFTAPAAQ